MANESGADQSIRNEGTKPSSPEASLPPGGGAAPRVLVVDDDPIFSRLLAHFLLREGFTTDVARSGDEAWEKATPPLALMLVDIRLPDADGRELIQRLRRKPGMAMVPVVFLTAFPLSTANALLTAGGNAHTSVVFKDKTPAELFRCLRKHLSQPEFRPITKEWPDWFSVFDHELNNQLAGIQGVAEILKSPGGQFSPGELERYGRLIGGAVNSLRSASHQVTRYAELKAEMNSWSLSSSTQGASAEITQDQIQRAAVRRASIWHRSADLSFDLRGQASPLRPVALQVVVEELVGHGCRYSPAGSALEIATYLDGASWVLRVTLPGVDGAAASPDPSGELAPGVDVSFSLVRLAIEPVRGTLAIQSSGPIGRVVTVSVPV